MIGCGVIFFSIVCFLLVYLPRAAPLSHFLLAANNANLNGKQQKQQKQATNFSAQINTANKQQNQQQGQNPFPPKCTETTTPTCKIQQQQQQQSNANNHLMHDDKSSSGNSSAHSEELLTNCPTSGSESGEQRTCEPVETRVDCVDSTTNSGPNANSGLLQRICARFGMQSQQTDNIKTSCLVTKSLISPPIATTTSSGTNDQMIISLKQQQQLDSGAGSDATTTTTTASGTQDNSRSSSSVGPALPAKPVYHQFNDKVPANCQLAPSSGEISSNFQTYQQPQQQQFQYYPQRNTSCWPSTESDQMQLQLQLQQQQQTAYDTIYSTSSIRQNQRTFTQAGLDSNSPPSHYVTAQYSAPIHSITHNSQYSPPAIPAKPQFWPPTSTATYQLPSDLQQQQHHQQHIADQPYQVVRSSPSSSLASGTGSGSGNTLHVSLKQAYPTSQTYVTLPVRPASTAQFATNSHQILHHVNQHQSQPNDQLHQMSTTTTLASSDAGDAYSYNRKLASLNDEIYGTRLANNNTNNIGINNYGVYGTSQQQNQFNIPNNNNNNYNNNKQANLDLSGQASNLNPILAIQQAKRPSSLTSLSQSSSMATNQTEPTSINNINVNNHHHNQQQEHPNLYLQQQQQQLQQQLAGSSATSSSQISPVMTTSGQPQTTTFTLDHMSSPLTSAANDNGTSKQIVVAAGAAASFGTHV